MNASELLLHAKRFQELRPVRSRQIASAGHEEDDPRFESIGHVDEAVNDGDAVCLEFDFLRLITLHHDRHFADDAAIDCTFDLVAFERSYRASPDWRRNCELRLALAAPDRPADLLRVHVEFRPAVRAAGDRHAYSSSSLSLASTL